MKTAKRLSVFLIITAFLFLLNICKDQPQSESKRTSTMDQIARKPASEMRGGKKRLRKMREKGDLKEFKDRDESKTRSKGKKTGKQKLTLFIPKPSDETKHRLLEYYINLTYNTNEFEKSRRDLQEILSKYGFVASSNASTTGSYAYMSIHMKVRADKFYDALLEFDTLGELQSENIRVTDHTENMFVQRLKLRRERIRLQRKAGLTRISPKSENWERRNRSYEQSEDREDKARHEKWKIMDKTSLASVNIYLKGPELPPGVTVPLYKKAFIGLVNMFLEVVYVLIWLLPLIIIVLIIIWKRKQIIGIFRKKKEEA